MRVLYVNHTGRVSGGEISLLTLLSGLPAGIEPAVACPPGELTERVRELGVRVLPIPGTDASLRLHPTRTPRALLEMARAAAAVRHAAAAASAEVVHANSIRAGLICARPGSGRKVVVHVRDCLPPGPASRLTLRAIGRADALVANSEYTRRALGPAAAGARVVYNPVQLDRFAGLSLSPTAARERLGLDGDGPVLGVVAQITPWKGQDDAIRMAGLLARDRPGLRLLLVGGAKFDSAATRYDNRAHLAALQRLAESSGLGERVVFLGDRRDVPEVLRAMDLLLAPSWEEPFGRSIVEAMAAGTPVVATAVGGPPEILAPGGEECGVLLPPRDPETWAAEIERLLENPTRRLRLAERARRAAAERFSVERHVASVRALYEELVAAST